MDTSQTFATTFAFMLTVVRKLSDLLSRKDRAQLTLVMLVLIVVAFVEVIGIASIMPFMAVVTNTDVIHTNQWLSTTYQALDFQTDLSFLTFLGILVLALLVLTNFVKATSTWLTLHFQNNLRCTMSRRLLARYMTRPYSFFLYRNTTELTKNVLTEIGTVVGGIVSPLTDILASGLVCLAIITLLIAVDPVVALAIATVLGGSYSIVYLLARKKLASVGTQQVIANAEKYKAAGEALSGIKDLKILGRESTFIQRYEYFANSHSRANIAAGVIGQVPRYALELIAFGGILLVVLYFIRQGQQAVQMIPLLALYAFAGYRLMPALQQLFAAVTQLRYSSAALDVIHRDLSQGQEESTDAESQLDADSHVPSLPLKHSLELRNVTFQYDGAGEPSIRDLCVRILPNTSVGLVGPTGCGKTTTVDLILGLLKPTSGQILADGIEITPENVSSWQKNLGYVPQHIYISDDSIARNIAFGVPDLEIDMDSVRKAATIANLADFVESVLPQGYDTLIGERGVRLSGGQRQRIGIARALYRDPAVLIMDEATSALDGITEEAVMDAVRTLSKRKTIILIAHRLTTVRECDVIYHLDQGSIVTTGRFEDLMRESEWFKSAAGA